MQDGVENRQTSGGDPKNTQDQERLARVRKSARDYYLRNRHWILEEQREKRRKLRRKKPRRKPKPGYVKLPPAEIERRRIEREERRRIEKDEWNELGWVVAKMNIQAKMSQERIYELLGGMATKKQISKWCAKGKKISRIKPIP